MEKDYHRPHTNDGDPECVLEVGVRDAGKSHGFWTWINRLAVTGAPGHAYVVETTRETRRTLENSLFEAANDWVARDEKGRQEIYTASTWDAQMEALRGKRDPRGNQTSAGILDKAGRGDVILFEHIANTWDEARHTYIRESRGVDPVEFLINARRLGLADTGGSKGLSPRDDWGVIKYMYQLAVRDLLTTTEAHVVITTWPKRLGDNEGKDVRNAFGDWGWKPAGEGTLALHAQTILLFNVVEGRHLVSTVKDRGGRKRIAAQPWDDLSLTYFTLCAGWHYGEEEEEPRLQVVHGSD